MRAVEEMGGELDSEEEAELRDTTKLEFEFVEAFAAGLAPRA